MARSTRINRTRWNILIGSRTALSTVAWISCPTLAKRLRQLGSSACGLIDQAPTYVGLIIFCAGYLLWVVELALSSGSTLHLEGGAVVAMIIGLSVMLASLPWVAYNRWMIAGRSGQSLGKRVTKTRLIGEETQAPIGALNAFLRDLVSSSTWLTVLGYLWPLWDDRRSPTRS